MRKAGMAIVLAAALWPTAASAQRVVDRIVARVGNGAIAQSELNELGRYQMLVDGREQPAEDRLRDLAEQWIVEREAALSGYTASGKPQVEKAYAELQKRFGSKQAFEARLKQLGLTDAEVKHLQERELFLARFLDYKFRPEAQVEEQQVEAYYRNTLEPELKKSGQAVPSLEQVADQVRELLIQKQISQKAEQWLNQMRARWKVETVGGGNKP